MLRSFLPFFSPDFFLEKFVVTLLPLFWRFGQVWTHPPHHRQILNPSGRTENLRPWLKNIQFMTRKFGWLLKLQRHAQILAMSLLLTYSNKPRLIFSHIVDHGQQFSGDLVYGGGGGILRWTFAFQKSLGLLLYIWTQYYICLRMFWFRQ